MSSAPLERRALSLSVKLLGLTALFVLVAEVLVFAPALADFRLNWLRDRLASAQSAALVIEAAPDGMIARELENDILAHVGAMAISVKVAGTRRLLAVAEAPPMVEESADARERAPLGAILATWRALFAPDGRAIRVIGAPPREGDFIEIVIEETPLKRAMERFALNFALVSLAIAALAGGLLYLALHYLFVRPMRRMNVAMAAFRDAPENPATIIVPSGRGDEIGRAEAELARMQRELQGTLQERARLAHLGLAVAKINHDLRNILTSAQLFSDRLATIQNPAARALAPKIVGALDRAIALCQRTLAYGKAAEPAPERRRIALAPLVAEVGAALGLSAETPIAWTSRVDPSLLVDADPDQLFRVLLNLGRNAANALSSREDGGAAAITISARREGSVVAIEVADTGPGVPEAIRPTLFQPFGGSGRAGGTGLGLAIAAELVAGHGGSIALAEGTLGATFLVTIPDRPVMLEARRLARRGAASAAATDRAPD